MDPYLGEIKLVPYFRIPAGWFECDGRILKINQHQALFSVLGNKHGGDGRIDFAIPDLRGRVPVHRTVKGNVGPRGGAENVMLNFTNIPTHTHEFRVSTQQATETPVAGNWYAAVIPEPPTTGNFYVVPRGDLVDTVMLDPGSLKETGASVAHTNMQPYLVLTYIMAWRGIYPSRT